MTGRDSAHLNQILVELNALGARLVDSEDARLEPAPRDMVVPRGFYSTTNHPTYVRLKGMWIPVEGSRMDCLIVVDGIERDARPSTISRRATWLLWAPRA